MKICMVTTSDIDYDSRILNEAESLSRKHQIIILARQYNHRKMVRPKVFQIKRINFRHWPIYTLDIFSSLFSLMKATWQTKVDVYHAHDLDGLFCAFPAALIWRKTLIYDSHEVWSEIFPFSNLGALRRLFKPLEKILMLKVKAGITVNKTIGDFLESKYHKKFLDLYNVTKFIKISQNLLSFKKKFPNKKYILHLGAADEGRGMEEIIKSVRDLPQNYVVIFIGGGKTAKNNQALVREECLANQIKFLPAIPPEEIISVIKSADIGLALTQKISLSYYYSLPNKIFQYIAAEVPILGSNFPEYQKFILKNKIGEVVDPSKPKLIAQKIKLMLKDNHQQKYRKNLVGLAKAKYNWSIEETKLIKFYEQVLK